MRLPGPVVAARYLLCGAVLTACAPRVLKTSPHPSAAVVGLDAIDGSAISFGALERRIIALRLRAIGAIGVLGRGVGYISALG